MNITQAATHLGVSPSRIGQLIKGGRFPGAKLKPNSNGKPAAWEIPDTEIIGHQKSKRGRKASKKHKPRKLFVRGAIVPAQAMRTIPNASTLRKIIDSWLDELITSNRKIAGLGDLTRNDIHDLANRFRKAF